MVPTQDDSKTTTKFRVAICGGGIAGICLALSLSKYPDIQVDLYEAAARFTEIGAGLTVQGRTWKPLELMGVDATLRKAAAAANNVATTFQVYVRRSDQPTEGSQFCAIELPYEAIHFHRAHFVDALVEHLPNDIAHFGKRLTSYSQSGQSGPIALQFADGSSASCDILVGCDGIKSAVRHSMMEKKVAEGLPEFSKYAEPVWTGTIAYRVLVPVDRLPSFVLEKPALKKPLLHCGKNKHVVTYCIAQGTMLNVVALVSQPELSDTVYDGPWATECNPAEMVDSFLDWEPRVREVLKLAEKPIKWAIHDLRPLPIYVSHNVALVGDSAHAMTPHQGSGAGQAIEDAYILGSLLGHPSTTIDTLPHALKAYEHVRLPLANNVLTCSRDAGLIYDFRSECGDDYEAIGATLSHAWDWMGEDGVEEQLQKALLNMMEALK